MKNKHLLGTTGIKDLKKNDKGEYIFNISNLSVQLLEKVEELYLYNIEQQKEPEIAKHNIHTALQKGKKVIIGTSGLTDKDYEEIERIANENNTSVLAAGNFALTVVLLQKFAEMAAKYIPHYEIIDYVDAKKIDAQSGTVEELACAYSLKRHQ